MVAVRLEKIEKRFGTVKAVDGVTLEIADGELFFLLGPSGCGKTTLLRTVAGFEAPDEGRVLFDGRDMTSVAPHRRNTGMVFQNYALWPHMTVFENVAYGLRARKVAAAEIERRAAEALSMVRMSPERERYPNQLSGGQQQRVALARALVIDPDCLLLDEPLSNLDAKLRLEMREEIRRIHRETGRTMIYVTHDQKEALSMAERMAVMRGGRVAQIGAPGDVYREPASAFVASFVGETNLIAGKIGRREGGAAAVETAAGTIRGRLSQAFNASAGEDCYVSVRPENVSLSRAGAVGGGNSIPGRITHYTFLGETGQYLVEAGGVEFKVIAVGAAVAGEGEAVHLGFAEAKALVLPDGEAR